MTLPTRIDYAADRCAPVPNRLDGQLDPARAVFLIHDMQEHFLRPYAPQSPVLRGAIDRLVDMRQVARAAGVPVIYTAQPANQDPGARGLLVPMWGPGPRPDGIGIIEELTPAAGERVFTKHRYSAFVRSDLGDWLTDQQRDQLVIGGVYAHIGVLATATDAFARDITPFVLADAIADFSAEDHEAALRVVASTCGIVMSTQDAARAVTAPPAPTNGTDAAWRTWLAATLGRILEDDAAGHALVDQPDRDLFQAGFDSLRTFMLSDELFAVGVDIDFAELVGNGTVGFLLSRIEQSGQAAP